MTTKDIINSLRVCNTGKTCKGCFLKDNKLAGCRVRLMDYAADRLERLQNDIEEERNKRKVPGNV